MSDDRKDLPNYNSPAFLMKVAEALQTYLGYRGDKLDRGVTVRDLSDAGLIELNANFTNGASKTPVKGPGVSITAAVETDLTPPPTPTNFTASAGITSLFFSHDVPTYTQGHGHSRTVVYGATRVTGAAAPTFSSAVQITEFFGPFGSYSTNPATEWHLWIKWRTVDGVLSAVPAGGTNGVVVTTGQDVGTLLTALTGQITASQLYIDLGSRINLIDGPTSLAGSVAARILAETQARLAADTTLGSSITSLQNTDATQASQVTTLQTRATSSESNIINLQTTTASQATSITSLTTRTGTAESNITNLQTTTANQASQITTLSTSTNNNTAAIQTEATTRANADGTLFAQYTVKLDVYDYVSGYGLASTATHAAPTSTFAVRADSFYIASPSGPGVAPTMPFIVRTTSTTINGVTVPVGVYITDAFIQNGTITNAKIGNAAIDDAKVANLSATKITAGSIGVGEYIQSTNYAANSAGWRINGNGTAELSGVVVRGTVYANQGVIGGNNISVDGIYSPQYTGNQGPTGTGWIIDSYGSAYFSNLKLRGEINAGSYNGYAWPASGGGAHLSAGGLLLGNANTGSYFQVSEAGNVNAPNFSIFGGNATFSGALSAASGTFSGSLTAQAVNAVDTINIAGNAVTIPVGSRTYGIQQLPNSQSTPIMSVTMSGTQGQPVWIHVQAYVDNDGYYAQSGVQLVVNGSAVLTELVSDNGNGGGARAFLNQGYLLTSSPSYAFNITVNAYGTQTNGPNGSYPAQVRANASLFAIAAKR